MRHTPGKKDGKWEFITLLDPTAQGTNISHPTLVPAERPCLVLGMKAW